MKLPNDWYKNNKLQSYGFTNPITLDRTLNVNSKGVKMGFKDEKQKETAGTPPDFRNDGVAIWINQTKDGEDYLSVQLFGKNGIKVNAFKPKPKE